MKYIMLENYLKYIMFKNYLKYTNVTEVYNVRKLLFQANLCEVFAEDKKQHSCGDLP